MISGGPFVWYYSHSTNDIKANSMLHGDFHIPTKIVKHKDQPVIEVRGLSFSDISALCTEHREDLNMVVELWQIFAGENTSTLTQNNIVDTFTEYAIQLLTSAPGLIAKVIAICADEISKVEEISRLPVSIQINSIEAIASLTAEDFGGAKEMLGKIMNLIGANVPKELKSQMGSIEKIKNLSGIK